MNMQHLMQQAQRMQEKMQQEMKKAQEELGNTELNGQAGAGMVKITMTGKHHVKRVEIDASLLTEDKDMLEDLIAAAVNDAVRNVTEFSESKMGKVTQGLNLPAGMKLPF